MESWENIILQWINCFCSSNNSIKSIEELQDGKIYYNLINRVIPWSSVETNENQKDMVLQFLRDEYPNFAFRNKNNIISNLCTASLILSRLSLEPIFHKSLCMNLDVDAQVTIKSILESVYALGKSITADDLCEIFSLSSKKDFKPLAIKPKFILEDFLKSPAARTIQNDNKQFEQAKQIRQLRAEIETMKYEKSELIEDMKGQDRQIKDLQNKLQEALMELKTIRADSSKRNSCNFSVEAKDRMGLETAYQQELESLEKYANDLQTDNYQLQDEKRALFDEVKLYKEKYQLLKEKNEHNEHAVETMLLQIEKKEDELMEMKLRYDELLYHVKERTKTFFNNQSICNQSFEVDDRILAEMSLNKSEALSSVIEIQLEEVRRDYNVLQKQYKNINVLLNIFMEEYDKLKRKNESLIICNRQTKAKLRSEYMTDAVAKKQNDLMKIDYIIRELIKKDMIHAMKNEIKLPLTKVLKGDMSKNTISLQLLNNNDTQRCTEVLEKNISVPCNEESDSCINIENVLEEYHGMDKIELCNEKPPLIKFNMIVQHQNESKKPTFVFKVLLEEIVTGLVAVTGDNDILKKLLYKITKNDRLTNNTDDYLDLINFVKHNFEVKHKCLNAIEDNKSESSEPMISTCDWKIVNSTWTSLSESLENDVKIHKVLLLLEQSWLFVSALLKDVVNNNFSVQSGFEQLLQKKDKIESELKTIRFENSQILSFNLIASVQFVTVLTSFCNEKTSSFDLKCLTILTENGSEVNLCDIGELNVQRRKDLATKIINVKRRIDNFNYSLNLYKEEMANAALKNTVQDNIIENLAKDSEISNDQTDDNKINVVCIDQIKQEIVDKEEQIIDQNKEIECNKVEVVSIKNEIPEEISEDKVCIESIKKEIKEEEIEIMSSESKNDKEDICDVPIKKEDPEIKIEEVATIEDSKLIVSFKKESENINSKNSEISDNLQVKLPKKETSSEKIEINKAKLTRKEDLKETSSSKKEIPSEEIQLNKTKSSKKEELKETSSSKKETPSEEVQMKKTESSKKEELKEASSSNRETPSEEAQTNRPKSSKKEEPESSGSSKSDMTPQQVEKYIRDIHEKYELKLEKMKDKMKSAFNSQVSALRREQEQSFKSRLDAMQAKFDQQCYNHSEELRKYKKHISELTTQLWDVGEKLIIEKQKKEEFVHRVKELKTRHESSVSQSNHHHHHQQQQHAPMPLRDKENCASGAAEPPSKMQSVRGVQLMGNAFRSEDEEGELFDTTYLMDVQRQRANPEVDRLSILQLRNAKCKPHLKSSYPAEMQFYPPTLTEDEIKSGSAHDETFNDSLSQSLLTGKKVKRKDRTRTGAETPRTRRRFSNIFRKPRLSLDHK